MRKMINPDSSRHSTVLPVAMTLLRNILNTFTARFMMTEQPFEQDGKGADVGNVIRATLVTEPVNALAHWLLGNTNQFIPVPVGEETNTGLTDNARICLGVRACATALIALVYILTNAIPVHPCAIQIAISSGVKSNIRITPMIANVFGITLLI
jgi:hypothetical protein